MQHLLVHFVKRSIHEAGEHAFEVDASFSQHADQVAYRAVVGEIHEIAEVAILELRKALPLRRAFTALSTSNAI